MIKFLLLQLDVVGGEKAILTFAQPSPPAVVDLEQKVKFIV